MKSKLHKYLVSVMPPTKKKRSEYLKPRLSELIGKSFYCPAIRAHIGFTKNSVDETIWNAKISKESTLLAANVSKLFRKATIIEEVEVTDAIKKTSSKKFNRFGFKKFYILKSISDELGTAKIIVGTRKNGDTLEYSVTSLYVKRKKRPTSNS